MLGFSDSQFGCPAYTGEMKVITETKLSASELANKFDSACRRFGYSWSIRSEVVTVYIAFTPDDKAAYVAADSDAHSLLSLVPAKGGSIWGTDGGSIGGHVGLTGGYYRLNKSGVSKRFLNALTKIPNAYGDIR